MHALITYLFRSGLIVALLACAIFLASVVFHNPALFCIGLAGMAFGALYVGFLSPAARDAFAAQRRARARRK